MTSEEKSEHGGHGQGPGVHGSDEKKKERIKKTPQSQMEMDPRLIDSRQLQCSATILSSCVMQCSGWMQSMQVDAVGEQVPGQSAALDWGRCSVNSVHDGSRRGEGKGRQMEHAGGWLSLSSLVELVRGLRS